MPHQSGAADDERDDGDERPLRPSRSQGGGDAAQPCGAEPFYLEVRLTLPMAVSSPG
jgi:hypothetical protein